MESFDAWSHTNGLKVNKSKTELIAFGSRQNCRNLYPVSSRFREDNIHESPMVRNLGVVFDKYFICISPGTLYRPLSTNEKVFSSGYPTCVTISNELLCSGQCLGPLSRPPLSFGLWKRVGQEHATPPKGHKLCAARCVRPKKI